MYLKIEREPPNKGEAAEGALVAQAPDAAKEAHVFGGATRRASLRLVAVDARHAARRLVRDARRWPEDTEVTGPIVLNLWVSSTSEDMDIFATIRNIDPDGKDVCEVGQHGEPVPCVTKGWLRASHRKLDPEKSLPYRPYHAHDERWWLKPDELVECQVEIWPTSMVFKKGHKLRLDIQPRDGVGDRALHALPRRLQRGRGQHDPFGRRQAVVSAAADHSAEKLSIALSA